MPARSPLLRGAVAAEHGSSECDHVRDEGNFFRHAGRLLRTNESVSDAEISSYTATGIPTIGES
jgi:hypothetical protein